jgi:uncharacterized protein
MYHIKIDLGKLSTFSKPAPSAKAILSPCVGICCMDDSGLCEGCLRTSAEIGSWSSISDAERAYVMDVLLPERQAKR